ncbi:LysR family transcriptional regulator [Pseudoxanthomonas sp. CF125]|uniref:LysR family transcriptional regulator n=1 Tax=Pseudoxanthomonas sp. CF125 TaxID=1855303 RepID=UPI00087FAF54|nr:LysR family transcriptional regulator [Pseudoxanthomonas sp. CF125]SDR07922.1 transcriptional regulator, LysR family [Pseudoxanthomonas sp. CF125]
MPRRFDHLDDVEAFVQTLERGSLTAAAAALETTPSVISRAISRLEQRLGVQLLRRTTRRLGLTDAGRLYLEQARQAFGLIDDAERAIQGHGDHLRGKVRLSAPTTYGHYRLPALLQGFLRAHPQVEVELSIANRNVDLVAGDYDLAIRGGELPDSGLVAHTLEDASLCLVAAPGYLEQAGTPQTLAELAQHACLSFLMPSTGRIAPWALFADGKEVQWTPSAAIRMSDDVLGVVSLAEAGIGICQTYDFIVAQRVQQGALVEVLPQTRGRSRRFSVVYSPHRRMSAASRALIEALRGNPR